MAKIKGVCRNIDECTKAQSREVQDVERTSPLCEECGKELKVTEGTAPDRTVNGGSGKKKLIAIIAGAIIVLGGGAACYYYFSTQGSQPEVVVTTEETIVEEPVVTPVVETPAVKEEPKVEKETKTKTPPTSGSGTLNLNYGTYVGDIKSGKADGQGKMTYNQKTLISKHDKQQRYAEAGQSVIGTWYGGELDFGKLYDNQGTVIETLTIGRAE